jgi:hypothetical protein
MNTKLQLQLVLEIDEVEGYTPAQWADYLGALLERTQAARFHPSVTLCAAQRVSPLCLCPPGSHSYACPLHNLTVEEA